MGELVALALKFGIAALPAIVAEYGVFAAFFAFFAIMPLGHMTIGLLLIVIGLFYPRMPARGEAEELKVQAANAAMAAKGSIRTLLIGIGALVIVLSIIERMVR